MVHARGKIISPATSVGRKANWLTVTRRSIAAELTSAFRHPFSRGKIVHNSPYTRYCDLSAFVLSTPNQTK